MLINRERIVGYYDCKNLAVGEALSYSAYSQSASISSLVAVLISIFLIL